MKDKLEKQFVETLDRVKYDLLPRVSVIIDKVEQSDDRTAETLLSMSKLFHALGTFVIETTK